MSKVKDEDEEKVQDPVLGCRGNAQFAMEEYDRPLDATLSMVLSLMAETKGWEKEKLPGKGHGDLQMDSREYKNGVRIFRGSRTIPGSCTHLTDIIWNISEEDAIATDNFLSEWRPLRATKDTRIDYAHVQLPWPIWNREAFYVIRRKSLSPKTEVIWATSVKGVELPVSLRKSKTVRMEVSVSPVHLSGENPDEFTISKVFGLVHVQEVAPNRCRVTRLIFGDPGGSIPNAITNRMGSNQVAELLAFMANQSSHQVRSRL